VGVCVCVCVCVWVGGWVHAHTHPHGDGSIYVGLVRGCGPPPPPNPQHPPHTHHNCKLLLLKKGQHPLYGARAVQGAWRGLPLSPPLWAMSYPPPNCNPFVLGGEGRRGKRESGGLGAVFLPAGLDAAGAPSPRVAPLFLPAARRARRTRYPGPGREQRECDRRSNISRPPFHPAVPQITCRATGAPWRVCRPGARGGLRGCRTTPSRAPPCTRRRLQQERGAR
jgi:hypothetical protein